MRLIHTVISAEGWPNPDYNGARMQLLAKLVDLCIQQETKLLVIPAGFLTAPDQGAMLSLIAQVAQLANEKKVAIIGGVDVVSVVSKRSLENDDLVRQCRLPNFGFGVGPVVLEESSGHPWRQTSNTSDNAHLVAPANVPGNNRAVTIDGRRVGVLICGELHSEQARNALAQFSWALLVNIGHLSMGCGLVRAMRRLALDACCPVAQSQHLCNYRDTAIHFVNARGEQQSQPTDANGLLQTNRLWAGWALRELTFPPHGE